MSKRKRLDVPDINVVTTTKKPRIDVGPLLALQTTTTRTLCTKIAMFLTPRERLRIVPKLNRQWHWWSTTCGYYECFTEPLGRHDKNCPNWQFWQWLYAEALRCYLFFVDDIPLLARMRPYEFASKLSWDISYSHFHRAGVPGSPATLDIMDLCLDGKCAHDECEYMISRRVTQLPQSADCNPQFRFNS